MGMAVFMVVSSTLQRARLCVLELVRPSCVQKQSKNPKVDQFFDWEINDKASPPGRHQEQAPKQRCTFSPTTFSSVQSTENARAPTRQLRHVRKDRRQQRRSRNRLRQSQDCQVETHLRTCPSASSVYILQIGGKQLARETQQLDLMFKVTRP